MTFSQKRRSLVYGSFSWLGIAIFTILLFMPIFWMISTAFKGRSELFLLPPHWIPHEATWHNFISVLQNRDVIRYLFNSLVVSTGCVILSLAVGSFAGYAFSRSHFPGSRFLMYFILTSQMFPTVLLLIALYVIFRKLHLFNNYLGLILSHSSITIPFSVWILKSFYDTIPTELEEAAYIDGCGKFGTFYQIILPLILPGFVATAIYSFLLSWNDFVLGLTLVTRKSMRILGPGIYITYFQEFQYLWEDMMALSLIVSIPLVVVFVFLQRLFIRGLLAGALKG